MRSHCSHHRRGTRTGIDGTTAIGRSETLTGPRTRPGPLRRGGFGRRGGLARVDDGVGRMGRRPGDDGRSGARQGVWTCPGEGFLAAGGARVGAVAMEGRSIEHGAG